MRYKEKRTGRIFENEEEVLDAKFCKKGFNCYKCPIGSRNNGKRELCWVFIRNNPEKFLKIAKIERLEG